MIHLKGTGIFALAALLCASAQAGTASLSGTVTRTMVPESALFGGCMALLNKDVAATTGLNCPSGGWITFSCTGDFTDKSNASRMFDAAQVAAALKLPVTVVVDDSRKHNGWCFARRITAIYE